MPHFAMHRFRLHRSAGLLLLGAVLAACTWVKSTPQGSKVRVVPPDRVADCRHVGELSVYTKAKVAGVDRNDRKIKQELETLARNEAATMNADTIVSQGSVKDGRQTYQVYRCL